MTERNVADVAAGNAFRDSLLPRADAYLAGGPLWHGWVIMDAYLAGPAGRAETSAAVAALVAAAEAMLAYHDAPTVSFGAYEASGHCKVGTQLRAALAPFRGGQ